MTREVFIFSSLAEVKKIVFDFHNKRGLLEIDLDYVEVTPLEEMESKRAVVLIKKEWPNLYALNIRKNWSDDEYFVQAQKLIDGKTDEKSTQTH